MRDATNRGFGRRIAAASWIVALGIFASAILTLALPLLPGRATAGAAIDSSEAVQREIAFLEFFGGGSPLTADEKRDAASMVQHEFDAAPKAEAAADAGSQNLLQTLQKAPLPIVASAREGGRLNVQLHRAVDPALQDQQLLEARIIEAHDPVVVFDPRHKYLVTVQTLRVLQQADMFGATLFDVPPPGRAFIAQMEQIIPRAWGNMDAGMQEAMAHAERDLPYAQGYLRGLGPGPLAGFVEKWRGKIMAPSDAAAQQLNLTEVMAVIGMMAFDRVRSGNGNVGGQLAYRLQLQDLVTRKLQEAVRSYSPACNVTRPDYMQHWAACHP